jgi:hypothetical protein
MKFTTRVYILLCLAATISTYSFFLLNRESQGFKRRTMFHEKQKSKVYSKLQRRIFSKEARFSEHPEKGGILIASDTNNKCARKKLVLIYYVHDRISLFSFVLNSVKQLEGLNEVGLIISIDHYDKQVVLEYAYMILHKLKSYCVTILWHYGENLSLSPYSISTPLSQSYCSYMVQRNYFCSAKSVNSRNEFYMYKRKFAVSAHVFWVFRALLNIYLRDYKGPCMFLEEDHIFSRDDALIVIYDMIHATGLRKINGTFAAGRYINEAMADVDQEYNNLFLKKHGFQHQRPDNIFKSFRNTIKTMHRHKSVSYLITPAFSNTGWIANMRWIEKIIKLRSTRFFPDWDWQFHILGKEGYLPSLHVRPNVSFIFNVGDCFGEGLHGTRTKYKYFLMRCTFMVDMLTSLKENNYKLVSFAVKKLKRSITKHMKTVKGIGGTQGLNGILLNIFNGMKCALENSKTRHKKQSKGLSLDQITFKMPNITGYVNLKPIGRKSIIPVNIDKFPLPKWLPIDWKTWNETCRTFYNKHIRMSHT